MSEITSRRSGPQLQYRWYMSGQALYFFAGGIGFVLNQWLITFFLNETPEVVGIAQMIVSLPQLIFVLFGGMAADRLELRGHLVRLQFISAIPLLLLAIVIWTGQLSTWNVVSISVAGGIISAFAQPARDSLLTRVTRKLQDRSIQQTITIANMLQFGAQIFGIVLVSLVTTIGPIPLIMIQVSAALGAGLVTRRLDPSPAEHDGEASLNGLLHDIWDGLFEAFTSPQIRPVMIWLGAFGFISMGIYLVVLPLMVRDIYHGGALEFSLIHVCFFGGVTIASYPLSKFGHFKYQGRMLFLAQAGTSSVIFVLSTNPGLFLFFSSIFGWGVAAALSMAMTRSIVQQNAPDTHRARILSVYQLVMFGGSPIGSFLAGYFVEGFGAVQVLFIAWIVTTLFLLGFVLFSNLWRMQAQITLHTEDGPANA